MKEDVWKGCGPLHGNIMCSFNSFLKKNILLCGGARNLLYILSYWIDFTVPTWAIFKPDKFLELNSRYPSNFWLIYVCACVCARASVCGTDGVPCPWWVAGKRATRRSSAMALQWGKIEFGLSAELISSVWPETRPLRHERQMTL